MSLTRPSGGAQRTLRLVLEYDGRRFDGWHGLPDGRTIVSELQSALERVLRERPAIHAAAATDPGVHAAAQVASLRTASAEPARRIAAELERELPGDLAVIEVADAAAGFHARHAVESVTWSYRLSGRRAPLHRGRSWLVPQALDRKRLDAAAAMLKGSHDLAGFADRKLAKSGKTKTELRRAEWRDEEPLLVFEVEADELSCRTVRRLVGALVAVGHGELSVEQFEKRLRTGAGPRKGGGWVAPPPGLVLTRVAVKAEALEAPLDGGPTAAAAQRAIGALDETAPRGR